MWHVSRVRVQQTVAYDKFHDNSLPLLKMSFSSKLLWLLHLEILAYLVDISKPENYGMRMSNLMRFKTRVGESTLETFSTFLADMQHMIFSGRMKLISNDSLTRSRFFWPRGGVLWHTFFCWKLSSLQYWCIFPHSNVPIVCSGSQIPNHLNPSKCFFMRMLHKVC